MTLPTELIVHWTYDDAHTSGVTLTDQGSAGLDGTLLNGVTPGVTDTPSGSGEAHNFDGISQVVASATSISGKFVPNPKFSLCAVARSDSDSLDRVLVSVGMTVPGGDTEGIVLRRLTTGRIRLEMYPDSSTPVILDSTLAAPINTWFCAIGSWDGFTMRVALRANGVTQQVTSLPSGPPVVGYDTDGTFETGRAVFGSPNRWPGDIAEVRGYLLALSASQEIEFFNLFGHNMQPESIPSAEAFGSTEVQSSNLINPFSIPSAEAFGPATEITVPPPGYLQGVLDPLGALVGQAVDGGGTGNNPTYAQGVIARTRRRYGK